MEKVLRQWDLHRAVEVEKQHGKGQRPQPEDTAGTVRGTTPGGQCFVQTQLIQRSHMKHCISTRQSFKNSTAQLQMHLARSFLLSQPNSTVKVDVQRVL